MLKTIILLGLMTETVSGRLYNNLLCRGSDGRCCTAKCRPDWQGHDGRCYYVSEGQSTFSDSQRYCAAHQASLVRVNGAAESDFLKVQIATLAQGCLTPDSVLRKDVNPQMCYWRSEERMSQPCAEKYCQKYGGELISVPDEETLEHIVCAFPEEADEGLWTAITLNSDNPSNPVWEDIDGNQQTFLPWSDAANQPNSRPGDDCIRIRDGLFFDAQCTIDNYVVCQIPRDKSTWIGVTDAAEEGIYRDLQGREIEQDKLEFADDEPNGGTDANCVGYQHQSGEYSMGDFDCHQYNHFICEYDPDCNSVN